jgi:glucokinase
MNEHVSPRLVADIGATNARSALQSAGGQLQHVVSLRGADHADFHAAFGACLGGLPAGAAAAVEHAPEGGHASFAPTDERELTVWRHAQRRFGHVSFERLVSGPGLTLIHEALGGAGDGAAPTLPAPEITRRALAGSDAVCVQTVHAFCAMLGSAAGNLALTLGAVGGVWIGGGIVPRLGSFLDRSEFRARFEAKGRFAAYLHGIPTWVITAKHAAFVGAAAVLDAQLRQPRSPSRDGADSGGGVLAQIGSVLGRLSPAERRVAELVLARPRQALASPIAEIARAAQASQPTVIRLCRTLGCEGLSDFKLRLASGLGADRPAAPARVDPDDDALQTGLKVPGNTAAAVMQLHERLAGGGRCRRSARRLGAGDHCRPFAAGQAGRRGAARRPAGRCADAAGAGRPHPAAADARHPGRRHRDAAKGRWRRV